jgi:polyisoprenoid-binding protein YceI
MNLVQRILAFSLLTLVCFTPLAWAAEQTLCLDPAGSRVSFHLDATLHAAEGTLALERGEIRFDLESGAAAGEIVIDATSANTDNDGRDKKLHREVLESATYPEVVFRPTSVKANVDDRGTGTVTLTGVVAIHGGEHEVQVTATVSRDSDRIRAEGMLSVPYVAWGMHDPSVFVLRVAKVVEVSFTITGKLAAGAPTATAAPEAGR